MDSFKVTTVAYLHGPKGIFYIEFQNKIPNVGKMSVKIPRLDVVKGKGITESHFLKAGEIGRKILSELLRRMDSGDRDADIVFRDEQASINP